MAFITDKNGNLSLFRVGMTIAFVGLLFAIGSFVLFQWDLARRQSPLFIDLYPGATEYGEVTRLGVTSQRVSYRVIGIDAETVAEFYQREMRDFDSDERCIRNPDLDFADNDANDANNDGVFDDYVEGEGTVPFVYRCVFDNSSFNVQQFTTVTIEPGVRNDGPETVFNFIGDTFVHYEQFWSR